MKAAMIALALLAATPAFAQAPAAPTQAAPATPYSVETTKIGTLLDTPALLVIFKKYLPENRSESAGGPGAGLDPSGNCAVCARHRDAGKAGRDGRRTESPAVTLLKTKRTTTTTKPNGAGIARA